MSDTRYNTPDLETELDATIEANDDNIYVEYYNAGSGDTVKNKKGLFTKLLELFLGESDTAWTTVTSLSNGWTGTVYYIKRAGMVEVVCDNVVGTSASSQILLTLPSNYRPVVNIWGVAANGTSVGSTTLYQVGTNGDILMYNQASIAAGRGTLTFPVL